MTFPSERVALDDNVRYRDIDHAVSAHPPRLLAFTDSRKMKPTHRAAAVRIIFDAPKFRNLPMREKRRPPIKTSPIMHLDRRFYSFFLTTFQSIVKHLKFGKSSFENDSD